MISLPKAFMLLLISLPCCPVRVLGARRDVGRLSRWKRAATLGTYDHGTSWSLPVDGATSLTLDIAPAHFCGNEILPDVAFSLHNQDIQSSTQTLDQYVKNMRGEPPLKRVLYAEANIRGVITDLSKAMVTHLDYCNANVSWESGLQKLLHKRYQPNRSRVVRVVKVASSSTTTTFGTNIGFQRTTFGSSFNQYSRMVGLAAGLAAVSVASAIQSELASILKSNVTRAYDIDEWQVGAIAALATALRHISDWMKEQNLPPPPPTQAQFDFVQGSSDMGQYGANGMAGDDAPPPDPDICALLNPLVYDEMMEKVANYDGTVIFPVINNKNLTVPIVTNQDAINVRYPNYQDACPLDIHAAGSSGAVLGHAPT